VAGRTSEGPLRQHQAVRRYGSVRGAGAAGESAREGAVRGPWELANNMSDILMREHMAPDVGNDNRNSGWDGVPSIDMNDAFEKYAFVQRKGSGRQGERRQAVARGCAGDGLDISKKGGVESKFLRENVREPAKLSICCPISDSNRSIFATYSGPSPY